MGQLIAIGGILLALAGLATFFVVKFGKGAKLEVVSKIQDRTIGVQHEQLKAAQNQPGSLDEWGKRIDDGEPI